MTVIMDHKLQTFPPGRTAWHTSHGYCTRRPVPIKWLMADKLASRGWKSCSPFSLYPPSTTKCIMRYGALQYWVCRSTYLLAVLVPSGSNGGERGEVPLLLNTLGFAEDFSNVGGRQAPSTSQIQTMRAESKAAARLPLPYVFLPRKPGWRLLPQIKHISNCWNVILVFWHLSPYPSPAPLAAASVWLGCKCGFQGLYIRVTESCETGVLHPNAISSYPCLSA